jgi:FKBP-type peptidyl-prolyl cis-trans isomerase 2
MVDEIKDGDTVEILFEAKLEDGTVFDKTEEDQPLKLTIGEGKILPAVENAIKGMKVGESKEIVIEPEDGFGPYIDELVADIPKSAINPDLKLELGMVLIIKMPTGKRYPARVIEIGDNSVKIDLNHPLAGKKLIFFIKLIKVNKKEVAD